MSSANTFTAKPYKPDNGFTVNGLVLLTTALALAGSALGYVAHHISRHFWLVLIFPLLLGFALGWVGVKMIVQGKIRNPWIGGFAGLLGGFFSMLVMHHSSYTHDRDEAISSSPVIKKIMDLPKDQREALLADAEADDPDAVPTLRALESFPAYLNLRAREGVSIGRGGSNGINLGYVGTWIYWVIEVALVAGVTFAMTYKQTKEPFCAECESWKTKRVLGSVGDQGTASVAIASGDANALARSGPNVDSDCILAAHVCPTCQGQKSDIDLLLTRFTRNGKGELTENKLSHHSWPGTTFPVVSSLFAPAAPTAAVAADANTPGDPEVDA